MSEPHFCAVRTWNGAELTAEVIRLPEGVQAVLYGGTKPHIGAVTVVDPQGAAATTQFAGHKDGVVSEKWAQSLAADGYRPAVVTAGIHYDGLSREQIAAVVALTDELLAQARAWLAGAGPQ